MTRTLNRLLVTLCIVHVAIAEKESNILKLSRPQKIKATTTELNATEDAEDKDESRKRASPLGFSRNNPELDWKNYLKTLDGSEEMHRDFDVDFMKEKLERTANSIQWLADLYDPLRWARVPGKVRDECRRDMESFLGALRDGKLWAAKMSDASGRYSSQFHFGNGFWLGSSILCRELNVAHGKNTREIDDDDDEAEGEERPGTGEPPFPLRFHVARLYLTLPKELDFSTRQVFLGLCLPSTCDRASLTSMLRASADRVEREGNSTYRSSGPKIHVVTVKPVPSSNYCAWRDPKFYVLSAIGGAILLLMVCATAYEYRSLPPPKDIESSSASNNNDKTNEDKNLNDDRGSALGLENGQELIEKGTKRPQKEGPIQKKDPHREGFWLRCLLAFSPTVNGSKIISTEPAAKDNLTCLHGLRVLSLGWVVMVHTYLQVFSIAENKMLRTVTERNFMFQTISNATFSVDTFFFISGLLVTILFYRSLGSLGSEKGTYLKTSSTKFIIMILYRFVRLTPAYLFVLGMNEIAIKQAQARTVFSPAVVDHLTCEKFWWRNALYLNSLYPRTEMCMLWSWYMANDTQFYVLGIFLLLLSVKYFKTAIGIVSLLIASSWFTTFSIAYSNDYIARIQEPFALFDELYDKPWLRAGPYFIGTITGYILFKTKCQLKLPLLILYFGNLVASYLLSFCVSLALEAPVVNLLKIAFTSKKRAR
ncbi:uncharacterized protein LOC105186838 isoform X2 [Harpegnathos saltator]|uniref:uncharacterized protein LOC105186838 isoform X2 n=1 Tax=Harpegnathos saltator TaxID=610380 RepID=UPI000DBED071|nr:uncharacterized protein LOC105186838 isoform X2 [Harpegnathos saltator]